MAANRGMGGSGAVELQKYKAEVTFGKSVSPGDVGAGSRSSICYVWCGVFGVLGQATQRHEER